jgi:hypothetical protein
MAARALEDSLDSQHQNAPIVTGEVAWFEGFASKRGGV